MVFPIVGAIDFGLIYPLLIIPLAIMGATNGFNILGGFNGLEAGMGAIILSFLGIVALFNNIPWVSLIAFCAVAALLGFLLFNKYPARIFPGDSLTYPIGALIAILAIVGNMEKFALILFAPYFIELLFNIKTKFKKECFGVPQKDGTLKAPEKTTSLTHVLLKYIKTEKGVVYAFWTIEILIGLSVLIITNIW
jgi:UDP-N-acetylglucosamine--dolichyl-phosphate N-acetylglucosaminephosphotransferase